MADDCGAKATDLIETIERPYFRALRSPQNLNSEQGGPCHRGRYRELTSHDRVLAVYWIPMPSSASTSQLLLSAVFGACTLTVVSAQPAGVFTAAQAQGGRGVYEQNCSACHGANFEGSGDAPALSGGTFMLKWGPKMVSELFGVIFQTMPPTSPGSLSEAAALNATAFILQRNGAQAGQQALTSGATTLIRTIANGQAPAANTPGQGRGGRGGGSIVVGAGTGNGRGGSTEMHGVTVSGEVKNYVPVTPEMLRNPPPEDWLIFG